MKSLVIALSSLLLLAFTLPALGGSRHGADCGKCGAEPTDNHLQRLQVQLDLSAEQQQQISQILTERQQKLEPLHRQCRELQQQLRQLGEAENFDRKQAERLAAEQADLKVAKQAIKHQSRQQIDAVLTAEQRSKHQQLRDLQPQRACDKKGCRSKGENCRQCDVRGSGA
ncbi:MAG: Spy/CpxP family protein refolding chaperone [Desulfuromonadales bacterium]|nr:Spy/CpxP family protein refolding chaperone [Desulfuromonadales bacterium]